MARSVGEIGWYPPDETSPLPEPCLQLGHGQGASGVPVSCTLFGLKTSL